MTCVYPIYTRVLPVAPPCGCCCPHSSITIGHTTHHTPEAHVPGARTAQDLHIRYRRCTHTRDLRSGRRVTHDSMFAICNSDSSSCVWFDYYYSILCEKDSAQAKHIGRLADTLWRVLFCPCIISRTTYSILSAYIPHAARSNIKKGGL